MKLDFVCIGAQKAGTTTLHDVLKQHPEVLLPVEKEARFAEVNEFYEQGFEKFWSQHFQSYSNQKIVGNINPNLQIDNRYFDRLYESFGKELKVLFILRNPIDRAYSHYLMSRNRGIENLDFLEALEKETVRIAHPEKHKNYHTDELRHFEKSHFSYVSRGIYSQQIHYLQKLFNSENIKIVFFDDLIKNKSTFFAEVLDFLGLDTDFPINYSLSSNEAKKPKSELVRNIMRKESIIKSLLTKVISSKKLKKKIVNFLYGLNEKKLTKNDKQLDPEVRKVVYEKYFKEEIDSLETLLNRDLTHWKIK